MTRAAPIKWSEKNTGEHEKFSAIWTNHNIIAALEDPRTWLTAWVDRDGETAISIKLADT